MRDIVKKVNKVLTRDLISHQKKGADPYAHKIKSKNWVTWLLYWTTVRSAREAFKAPNTRLSIHWRTAAATTYMSITYKK